MRGPMGDFVRRALSWGVFASLLLPILVSSVVGLGALLAALGDAPGGRFCGRFALLVAVCWFLAVVATAVLAGVASLAVAEDRRCRGPGRRRRRRLRHRWAREPGAETWGDRSDAAGLPQRRDPGAG